MQFMHTVWFTLLAFMLTAYAVLDGFDFGAGIVHLFVAKTDEERRTVFSAIGPFWDGNEVWLIASGGVFVFAFPGAYAAAFSGLYLALMVVLWLLVVRGLSIEFRSQVANSLWRAGWDATFAASSTAMALVLGVALGNVVRGVPIGMTGSFHEDLFTTPGSGHEGAIDGFTAVYGLFSVSALAAHGATFLAWKTRTEVAARSRSLGRALWGVTVGAGFFATAVTLVSHPELSDRVVVRPWLWPLPLLALLGAAMAFTWLHSGREREAFLGSCLFVASMLLATAGALFPTILRSTIDPAFSLDAHNAASNAGSLGLGLALFLPAVGLAVGYFVYLFHSFRGKASPETPIALTEGRRPSAP